MSYKIKFDKKKCQGSGLCASISPENWEMVQNNNGDMKAKPKKLVISEDEYDSNVQAEDMCPLSAILIEKIKNKAYQEEEFAYY